MLDVDLVARATGHGGLDEGRVDAEIFGEGHGRLGVADAVDVGKGQPGVRQRAEHHGDLKVAAEAIEFAGRGDVVRDAHDGGSTAQTSVDPAHP